MSPQPRQSESGSVIVDRALLERTEMLEERARSALAKADVCCRDARSARHESASYQRYCDVLREAVMRLRPLAREASPELREAIAHIAQMHPEHWGPST